MTNVIEFPSGLTRNLSDVERLVRGVASRTSSGEDVVVTVMAAVRPLIEILSEPGSFSVAAQGARCHVTAQALRDQVGVFLTERDRRVILERVQAEFHRILSGG